MKYNDSFAPQHHWSYISVKCVQVLGSLSVENIQFCFMLQAEKGEEIKKDIPRSRKDYLIRHHLERTTGAGKMCLILCDFANWVFWHLSELGGVW